MSDQETAVVEETIETGVENQMTEGDISLSSSPAEISETPEVSPTSEVEAEVEPESEPTDAATADEPISILNLKPRQHLTGKVKNITNFGAFVDIGLAQDGLVHISELSHKRVARVSDVVKEGDEIEVSVLSVDPKAQRISLSMKNVSPPPEPDAPPAAPEPAKPKPARQPAQPLLGGLGRSPKGAKFGLKW